MFTYQVFLNDLMFNIYLGHGILLRNYGTPGACCYVAKENVE